MYNTNIKPKLDYGLWMTKTKGKVRAKLSNRYSTLMGDVITGRGYPCMGAERIYGNIYTFFSILFVN